jgi:hypothetical protein
MNKVTLYAVDDKPTKICPSCGYLLPLTDFAQDNSKSDGRTSYCKDCRNSQKKSIELQRRERQKTNYINSREAL